MYVDREEFFGFIFFFQAEDGIRDGHVTGVQTCALPISRSSGDPYVTHCVEVAKTLADLQLDTVTVAAGLLHDVVEDTTIVIADVEREFGAEIGRASCRERVEIWGVEGRVQGKSKGQMRG